MKVSIVRLVTGEELIGECDIDEHNNVVMTNPAQIHYQMSPDGKVGVGFMPYAHMLKDRKITISGSHVVYFGEPIDDAYNQYNTMFGSGLVVARGNVN